jgi:hypothetical protein
MQLQDHRHNLKEDVLEKSKLAQHAYEEGHRVICDEARILKIENSSRHRKYKESAYMVRQPNNSGEQDLPPLGQ